MINKLKQLFAGDRKPQREDPMRPATIFDDDVYLVSYPKSGNTWMRMLIANYALDGDADLETFRTVVPDIHKEPRACDGMDRPRVIKSHAPYMTEYPRVVYIARDGRDVMVSLYHFLLRGKHIAEGTSFAAFYDDYLARGLWDFGRWGEHVTAWLDQTTADLMWTTYETMKADTAGELRKTLAFIGYDVDEDRVARAVERSEFDRLKKMEKTNPGWHKDGVTDDKPFFRKGGTGQWRDVFDDARLRDFEQRNAAVFARLGYPSSIDDA